MVPCRRLQRAAFHGPTEHTIPSTILYVLLAHNCVELDEPDVDLVMDQADGPTELAVTVRRADRGRDRIVNNYWTTCSHGRHGLKRRGEAFSAKIAGKKVLRDDAR